MPRVGHRDDEGVTVAVAADGDQARLVTGHGGGDGVVDQVAEHGGDVFDFVEALPEQRVVGDGQTHAALAGLDRLRSDERLQGGVAHEFQLRHGEVHRAAGDLLVEERARLA